MKRELYISGRLIDLSEDQPIALSYQVNDIAELSDRQANYSNRFTIPDTNNNSYVLNFTNSIPSNTKAPYRKLPCTYIQNGIPVIQNGIAIIEQYSGSYDITIYSGIYDFFQQIGDKTLLDIDWSELNHTYNVSTILGINNDWYSGNNTKSCWPLINWGGYSSSAYVDIKYQLPVLLYPFIIDKIFSLTTYSKSGLIFTEPIYNSMALTLSPDVFTNDDAVNLSRSFKSFSSDTLFKNRWVSTEEKPVLDLLKLFNNFTPSGGFDSTDGEFHKGVSPKTSYYIGDPNGPFIPDGARPGGKINTTAVADIPNRDFSSYISKSFNTVEFKVHMYYYVTDDGAQGTVYIKKNGVVKYKEDLLGIGQVNLLDVDFSIPLVPGDVITITIEYRQQDIYQSSLGDYSYVSATITDTLAINTEINYNKLIPEIKLKDIIKNFAQKFALIISTSKTKREMIFTEFKEIKQNTLQAQDWSEKIDVSNKETISYRIGNYTQTNNLRWAADDKTNGIGDSAFLIDDLILDTESDLFELIFPACLPFPNIRTTTDQQTSGNEGVQIPRFTLVEADIWEAFKTYSIGDQVNRGNVIWISLSDDNINKPPESNLSDWEIIAIQYTQSESSLSRLVVLRSLGGNGETVVTYTDGTTPTDTYPPYVPLAYFGDLSQPYDLTFSYLIQHYYSEIVHMLNNLKVLNQMVLLSEADILNLDFLTLKYIRKYGNYFYLNKVDEFIEGQSANCQLIRM